MFISRLYLHKVGQGAPDQVVILDEKGVPVSFNDNTDDLFIELESVTGAAVKINFDIQTNVYLENNSLFSTGSDRLLPFFVLRRDETLSDSQMKEIFGPLTTFDRVKVWSRWISLSLSVILLFTGIIIFGVGFKTLCGKSDDGNTTDGGEDDKYYKKSQVDAYKKLGENEKNDDSSA